MTAKPQLDLEAVREWLTAYHGPQKPVSELEALDGGYWSKAFGYRLLGDTPTDLVVRFSGQAEGYRIDRQAYQFAASGLPVPEVLAIGEALGQFFAVSRRLSGKFIEVASVEQRSQICSTLSALLAKLRANRFCDSDNKPVVEWYEAPDQGVASWWEWLRLGLGESAQQPLALWRSQLPHYPELEQLFVRTLARIDQLKAHIPERRDLVHGDLLHQNVLVNDDGTEVTGIFSWKCSAFGDFLYDVAWCTLWASWFPALDADDLWQRTFEANDLSPDDLQDAALRHHCYELQIAASHLGWFITSDDETNRRRLMPQLQALLDAGPRSQGLV